MVSVTAVKNWPSELERWIQPFVDHLDHKVQRTMAPLYLLGLLTPGRRKSIEPMAQRVAGGQWQSLHHFVNVSEWDVAALEAELARQASALVGGAGAHLIVDDTALRKKGRHSAGVARQWCGETGKLENCQVLVSLTLAKDEAPVCVGLRLFLPKEWADDQARREKCRIPEAPGHLPKWRIALTEIDRLTVAGVVFDDVLADAGYGHVSAFRRGLSQRRLRWAVGVESDLQVYPDDVMVRVPAALPSRGRPATHPAPSCPPVRARDWIDGLGARGFRSITWRRGVKGPLRAEFAVARVRVAEGRRISQGRRLPGDAAWLVCERRTSGERKYYLSNLPESATRLQLARQIKARWACEQPHQQMKQELGLDHFEGRSWRGLHHHCLLTMIAYCFLQHLRLSGKKNA